ncbi:FtsX-like permease family protein [bacterium]|nr:FtsX-like permease family protein [bacterium]
MKYVRIVVANLLRKKVRALLTVGSFAVALFLFGVLATIRTSFGGGVEVAGADRLAVINKTSLIMPLPISYRDRILAVPGVADVTYSTWFGGVYQDEKNFFPQFAVDADTWFRTYPEFVVPPEQLKAFRADRQGCVVGRGLAKRFGWRIGDRIPLRGTIWTGTWEFNLRGIYDGKRAEDDVNQFWFRYDYLEERRTFFKGLVGWYVVRVANPDEATKIVEEIDARFADSPYETSTQTERAFAAGFVKQMGNIEFLILSIGGVVFFTLLLVTGNTMAIAVRERTGELAVLKTLGYSDRAVLGLVLAESATFAGVGGGIGLALAKGFTMGGDPTHGMLGNFYLSSGTLAFGFALAIVVGLAAGLPPALSAMRLDIVEALRRV